MSNYQKYKNYYSNYMKDWSRRNKDKVAGYKLKLKIEVLTHYSNGTPKCVCCGKTEIRFLTLDHIKGDGEKQRLKISGTRSFGGHKFYCWLKNNNYPNDVQVMCADCNMAKGRSKNQFCPVHHPE